VVGRVILLVTLVSALAAATADAGYGPPTPPGPPVPGGFSTVVASKTFGTAGGTLVARSGSTHFSLHVGRQALKGRLHLTLTRPRLQGVKGRLPRGTTPVIGFALLATRPDGRYVTGAFARSGIRLTIVDRRITKRSTVLVWSRGTRRFVRYAAVVSSRKATLSANRIHEFVVASPR
jgi:hypothetical protein